MHWVSKERQFFARRCCSVIFIAKGKPMKKILIAAAVTLMCGSAFAQNTGPAPQGDTMNKPGMTNSGSGMNSGTNSGTTGTGMQKEGMTKDGMSKDGNSKGGMKNDSMSKDSMKK
jgi:pentapeptide MXKDX repeat protein